MALLSDSDRKDLEVNPNVSKVTKSNVTYTSKFKIKAVKLQIKGKAPRQIFMEAGINIDPFQDDYPKKCIQRWRKIFEAQGEAGLKQERRGKSGGGGRPKKLKFKNLEAEVAYLRAELELVKKLRALRILESQKNKSSN